ncbi:glycoside hydrolase family 15 protein [Ralstonia solanacearum]|uniref:glycoside hydrolase family 15 protein n=1 Tax=Ralstonia solanacearum TaxID=305 RepID=UPI001F4A0384|nr:glycoside hydrolase family 15 protein [Ralstonia solanacearum]
MDALEAQGARKPRWGACSGGCGSAGKWADALKGSLIRLKGLTFHPTGGLVAAPTTSLPKKPGGVGNWDYRYCWLGDATLTLLG